VRAACPTYQAHAAREPGCLSFRKVNHDDPMVWAVAERSPTPAAFIPSGGAQPPRIGRAQQSALHAIPRLSGLNELIAKSGTVDDRVRMHRSPSMAVAGRELVGVNTTPSRLCSNAGKSGSGSSSL